tara:strand:+ start:2520 stop:5459 length:2940 start_codon:yes stop_codon:yes gene_type:complete
MIVATTIAIIGAGSIGAFAFAGAIGWTAVAYSIIANVVLGAALRALTPKPSTAQSNRGYQTTAIGTALDHQVIYGKMRVAGARIYDEATGVNNKHLHRILAVAGHEIESFDELYVNDELVTTDSGGNVTSPAKYSGKLRFKLHLGATDQTADASLVSESVHWTTQHTLNGIAYMYVRMAFDADVFPNGIPEFTAVISGKKVYDPRTSTTAWSDNPALCMRDYLVSGYGLSEEPTNIDDTLVTSSANVCDQLVGSPVFKMYVGGEYKIKTVGNTNFTLYGAPDNNVGTLFIATGFPTNQSESGIVETARYTCNGAFTLSTTPYDLINSLLTSMDGSLWYSQGKWRMKPAYWTAPVLDLNEDDLRSTISVSTRHSRRNNFNTVKGTFRGAESNWQTTDYPQVTDADYLTADNNQESVADIDLAFTDNSVEARRIALISLERNRQQLTVNASFGLKTLQVQVGDNIRFTNSRFGWTNKEFEVVSWNFGLTDGLDLQTQMTLRETAESVYDEVSDGVVYERDNTTLLSPFEVPSVGIALEVVTQSFVEKVSNNLRISITSAASERIGYVDVEVKYKSSSQNIKQELLPEALLRASVSIQPEKNLFKDTVINGRPLGDLNDDGLVTSQDALQYSNYLDGNQTDQGILDYINEVFQPYILSKPSTYFNYLTVHLSPETEYASLGQGTLGTFIYKDAPTGIYDVRARAYNTFGIIGEWEYYLNFTLTPNLPTPEDVTSLSVDVSSGDVTLEWEPVTTIDLSHYSIRHSPVTSGATWANSTTSVLKIGRPSTSVTLPARAGTYLVKAHTKLEKESVNATQVVVLPDQIEGFTNSLTLTEESGFSGTRDNTTVVGNSLELASVAFPYSNGSYVFSSDIDTTSDKRVLARIDCTSIRRDLSSGLFDDLSGNFDSLTGLFDDLTGAANFSDTNVEFYIATKLDGGSFGDYQKFRVGYYYGRYFRFKVILKSNSSGITPSVSALTAYVEYN